MRKIPTIFDRDWEGNKGVVNKPTALPFDLEDAVATEKLDGTNVRVTVRNGEFIHLEKRRNPTREQKQRQILDPWYVEANREAPTTYDELRDWLPRQRSKVGDGPIEGIVWHYETPDGAVYGSHMAKLKVGDFRDRKKIENGKSKRDQ